MEAADRTGRVGRIAGVGGIAAVLLVSILAAAPTADALPPGYYEVGCGNELALARSIEAANSDGIASRINIKGHECEFKFSSSYDRAAGDNALPVIEDPGQDLSIYGHDARIVRKDGGAQMRLLEIAGGGVVKLHNLTLTGGELTDVNLLGGVVDAGGGLLVGPAVGSVVLDRVTVKDNRLETLAAPGGAGLAGGIFAAGPLTLFKSTVKDNEILVGAVDGTAELIIGGGIGARREVGINRSAVRDNRVTGLGRNLDLSVGGGLVAVGPDPTTIAGSRVEDNAVKLLGGTGGFVAMGGGVAISDGALAVDDTAVVDNTMKCVGSACFAGGGGIGLFAATATLTSPPDETTVRYNTVRARDGLAVGGGILAVSGSSLSLAGTDVAKNEADGAVDRGGGIYLDPTSSLVIDDAWIARNKPGNCYGDLGAC